MCELCGHSSINTMVIIGSGNMATRLGLAFKRTGKSILQVYSRDLNHARELAQQTNSDYTDNPQSIVPNADVYLIAVADSAIEQVSAFPVLRNKRLIHTAGSVALDVLTPYTQHGGVFYPLQTLSKQKEVDFTQIAICIESNDEHLLQSLATLGMSLSREVFVVDSAQRMALHVAAVFVGNFSNHMYALANQLCNEKGLPFEILKPLIEETSAKALQFNPAEVQTGPARRGDLRTIQNILSYYRTCPICKKSIHLLAKALFVFRERWINSNKSYKTN